MEETVLMRDRNYRIFLTGQAISWLGGWTQSVAQGWLVWSLTKSPAQLALTAVMVSLPALLFSLAGGVTADRVDRRTLLICTQGAAAVPAALLGLLTACGAITPSLVLLLAFLQGSINAFDVPARQAFLAEMVPRHKLRRAIAFNSVSFNATRMIGPAIAGGTLAAFGAAPCFFLNALSFLAGVGTLFLIRGARPHAASPLEAQGEGTAWSGESSAQAKRRPLRLKDMQEGVSFVVNERELRRSLLMVAMVSLFAIPFVPLLPVFADSLGVGARGLGVMSACAGSGSLLAALALALGGEVREKKEVTAAAGIACTLALLLFARSADYRLSVVALFLAGAGLVFFLALVNGFIQENCPERLRGRVMGTYSLVLLGSAPLGSGLMGVLSAQLGAARALSLSTSIGLSALVLISLPSARRRSWIPEREKVVRGA